MLAVHFATGFEFMFQGAEWFPPVVAGIVGRVVLRAGAAIGEAAVASHRGKRRDTTSANNNTVLRGSRMSACMAEYVSEDVVNYSKDFGYEPWLLGIFAPACMEAIRAYNDDPNIVNLKCRSWGTTTVLKWYGCSGVWRPQCQ